MTEKQLQSACFIWIWNKFPTLRGLCWHVPNEGKRSLIEGNQLKAQGLVKGVPDMEFHYQGKSYFFELKTEKGRLSKEQAFVQQQLEDEGFEFYVIRSFEQFKDTINEILKK